jgi:hypothetical protein
VPNVPGCVTLAVDTSRFISLQRSVGIMNGRDANSDVFLSWKCVNPTQSVSRLLWAHGGRTEVVARCWMDILTSTCLVARVRLPRWESQGLLFLAFSVRTAVCLTSWNYVVSNSWSEIVIKLLLRTSLFQFIKMPGEGCLAGAILTRSSREILWFLSTENSTVNGFGPSLKSRKMSSCNKHQSRLWCVYVLLRCRPM